MFLRNLPRLIRMLFAAVLLLTAALSGSALAQTGTDDSIEVVGAIEALTDTTLTINGLDILITDAIVNVTLSEGLVVKVETMLLADGTLQAIEIDVPAVGNLLPGETELIGELESLDEATAVLLGLTIDLSTAEIGPDVAVGEIVKVHVSLIDDVWVARAIELFIPGWGNSANLGQAFEGNEFEFSGTLDEVGDGYIVVGGQRLTMTQAEVKTQLLVGMQVRVHARLVDGQWQVREVEAARFQQRTVNDDVFIPANCAPTRPAGWTTHTVRAGDTLSALALRTEANLNDLVLANCLHSAHVITVGAQLFVPREPVPALDSSGRGDDDRFDDNSSDDRGNDNRSADRSDDSGSDDRGNDDRSDDRYDDSSGSGSSSSDDYNDDSNDDSSDDQDDDSQDDRSDDNGSDHD